jgi:uncharacterized protein (TIGR01244 family)
MGPSIHAAFMIRLRPAPALLVALLLVGCAESADRRPEATGPRIESDDAAVAGVEPASLGGIPNLTRAGNLYFAGQPSPDDWALLPGAGITAVITLRHDAELGGFDEEEAVRDLGLEFASIPWNGPAELTDETFDRTRELLGQVDSPTLFHCGSANRVGAVWLPYRVLDQGVDVERAVEEARRIGLRTPEFEARALDYIARNLEAR